MADDCRRRDASGDGEKTELDAGSNSGSQIELAPKQLEVMIWARTYVAKCCNVVLYANH